MLLSKIDIVLALPFGLDDPVCFNSFPIFFRASKKRTAIAAECMSTLTGQIVDSFSNILLAKYFARTKYENARVLDFLQAYGNSMFRCR